MTKYIFYLFIALTTAACSRYPVNVEQALKFAGDNREELKKVLDHYKADPLKYKAALFLIGNMPGHYSYVDTTYLNAYYDEVDSVFAITKNADIDLRNSMYKQIVEKYSKKNLAIVSDARYVRSDYLIDNIDNAFSVWQNGNWATHLNFEEFCEYLLPYKVCETQILDRWRFYFDNFAAENLDKLYYCKQYQHSVLKACEVVNLELKYLLNANLPTELQSQIPVRRMSTLTHIPYGYCDDYMTLAAAVMRSKGIPVAIDFTPKWPFRRSGHSWNVLLSQTGKHIAFEGCMERPGMPHKEDHIFAKIYRNTYAVNKEIEKINTVDTYVPAIFRNVYMEDVTSEYMSTVDVKMKVSIPKKAKYVYLSVFNDNDWAPVCWGKISLGKATFKYVGKDVLYLPVGMTDNGVVAVADPVIVDRNGKITYIRADIENKQTMTLNRKFPVFTHFYDAIDLIVGGQIQVSNHPDFKDFVILHTIEKYGVTAEDVFLDHVGEYRYWRYFSPKGAHCNIAELVFYGNESPLPIRGKKIGTQGSLENDKKYEKEAAFDGDALTYFDAPDADNDWVGMDFGKPVAINRIYYMPRSDGNLIEIGDNYELVYWDGHQWQSLGRQQATGSRLVFENCPSNGLYLLHDLTKGEEERIFTYENGEQIWW